MKQIITRREEAVDFLKGVSSDRAPFCVFDTEKTGLRLDDHLLGIAITNGVRSAYLCIANPYLEGIELSSITGDLNQCFSEGNWICHNALFDVTALEWAGVTPPKIYWDTLIAAHLWNPDCQKKLETRLKEDLRWNKKTFEEIIGKKWPSIKWDVDTLPKYNKKAKEWEEPLITNENLGQYAIEDVEGTLALYHYYKPKIDGDPELSRIMEKIELPLIEVLKAAKIEGVPIDSAKLRKFGKEIRPYIEEVEQKVYDVSGFKFNVNSPKQVGEVLFDKLSYPVLKATKTGNRSTDAETLNWLSEQGFEVASLLKEHHEASKHLGTYVDAIPELLYPDGRLRGDLNSSGTRTGRFSSSNPNLQNQPARGDLIERFPVREAFIPPPGHVFLAGDYSQIEPRLMAHMSQDSKLIGIYHTDGDIYNGVAAELSITRKQAKIVVLAIMYGMGPQALAASLGISQNEAKLFINEFYAKYRTLAQWKTHVEKKASRTGEVRNIFGRRRLLPGAMSSNNTGTYFSALRKAINTTIQGSAADLIKIAMVNCWNTFKEKYNNDPRIVLQVHDELIVSCPWEIAEEALQDFTWQCENVAKFRVPIKFEAKIVSNWWQLKDDDFPGLDMSTYSPTLAVTAPAPERSHGSGDFYHYFKI